MGEGVIQLTRTVKLRKYKTATAYKADGTKYESMISAFTVPVEYARMLPDGNYTVHLTDTGIEFTPERNEKIPAWVNGGSVGARAYEHYATR